jgi:hypothetical protein
VEYFPVKAIKVVSLKPWRFGIREILTYRASHESKSVTVLGNYLTILFLPWNRISIVSKETKSKGHYYYHVKSPHLVLIFEEVAKIPPEI